LDEDAQAADLLQEYEARIAALERMVGIPEQLILAIRDAQRKELRNDCGRNVDNRGRSVAAPEKRSQQVPRPDQVSTVVSLVADTDP
jgi:hypothetical protein